MNGEGDINEKKRRVSEVRKLYDAFQATGDPDDEEQLIDSIRDWEGTMLQGAVQPNIVDLLSAKDRIDLFLSDLDFHQQYFQQIITFENRVGTLLFFTKIEDWIETDTLFNNCSLNVIYQEYRRLKAQYNRHIIEIVRDIVTSSNRRQIEFELTLAVLSALGYHDLVLNNVIRYDPYFEPIAFSCPHCHAGVLAFRDELEFPDPMLNLSYDTTLTQKYRVIFESWGIESQDSVEFVEAMIQTANLLELSGSADDYRFLNVFKSHSSLDGAIVGAMLLLRNFDHEDFALFMSNRHLLNLPVHLDCSKCSRSFQPRSFDLSDLTIQSIESFGGLEPYD